MISCDKARCIPVNLSGVFDRNKKILVKYYRVARSSRACASSALPTIRPLIIECDKEHPSYSRGMQMSPFFATQHSSWDLDGRFCSPGSAFLCAATKVDLTPRESGSTLPTFFLSSFFTLRTSCRASPRFDLSRCCQQPLINVREQPTATSIAQPSRTEEVPLESRWLFLSGLGASGRNPEDSSFLLAIISGEISIRRLLRIQCAVLDVILPCNSLVSSRDR